jgi:hypothetical protein
MSNKTALVFCNTDCVVMADQVMVQCAEQNSNGHSKWQINNAEK